jgi:hypothetical protein
VGGADRAGQCDVADAEQPDAVRDGDGVHVLPGGELPRDLGDDLGRGRVADVLELGHRPAAVVVADDAAEGDDRTGPLVGDGLLVRGDRERLVDDTRDHGADGTSGGGRSRSVGSASPVQSTSSTSCAAR